jgi:hypothetical protein
MEDLQYNYLRKNRDYNHLQLMYEDYNNLK